MRASASDSCTRYDAAWLDREEVLYMKLMPASSFFKELEGEIQHANLDGLVAEENWEALADISRGLSTVFGALPLCDRVGVRNTTTDGSHHHR